LRVLLGWVVSGSANFATFCYTATKTVSAPRSRASSLSAAHPSAAADLARLWQFEEMGIKDPDPEPNLSADDAQAVHQFKSSLRHDGGTYTVAVPKKPSITTLNNNKSVAAKRLQSKIADLKRAEGSYERYDREINAFIERGHAIEIHDVDEKAMDAVDGSYYMPHHQVVSERDGKTKWRVVFDCSSHRPGRSSLNEHLLVGPNVNPDLLAMLLSFRAHQIAVSADIAQAYLCIRIAEEDQRLFRCFWRGPRDQRTRVFQMVKVVWGAGPSGYLLAATLRHHLSQVGAESLGGNFYHDDFVISLPDSEAAERLVTSLVSGLQTAGMKLAKWKTNSPDVAALLRELGFDLPDPTDGPAFLKVLGISWSPQQDTL